MAVYKLHHFNTRFLAEPIRFIFAYADVPFEDDRISTDEWRNFKDSESQMSKVQAYMWNSLY